MALALLSVLQLLVVAASAQQQCVSVKSTPTAGICKDYPMSNLLCTSKEYNTSDKLGAMMTSSVNTVKDQALCLGVFGGICPSMGGTLNPDTCGVHGLFCRYITTFWNDCKTDAHCVSYDDRQWCCSNTRAMINLVCIGVNASKVEALISKNRKSGSCLDIDCLELSSASSLRLSTLIPLSAIVIAVALIF